MTRRYLNLGSVSEDAEPSMVDDVQSSPDRVVARLAGPIAIVGATLIMAFHDAIVKSMSFGNGVPLWQLFFLRSLLLVPFLAIAAAKWNKCGIRSAFNTWVLVRSALIVGMYICFYASLTAIDLSFAAAIYYTAPIFITIFSATILRDKITIPQVFAIAIAFCGVLVVLQPSQGSFSLFMLLPLLSAICYALAAVATKGKTTGVNPWALTLSLNVIFLVTGALGICVLSILEPYNSQNFLTQPWISLHSKDYSLITMLAVISVAIHVLLARAYQLGPVVVIASLDFSYLAFAAIWSLILLRETPDFPTIVGTSLIALSGIWATLTGRRLQRQNSPTALNSSLNDQINHREK